MTMENVPGPNYIVPTAPSGDASNRAASTAFVTAGIAGNQAFPSGTVLLFYQAAAPTGWTQVTTSNDVGIRIVSGTGGGTGGSTAFTTVFAQTATGAHTLTTAESAAHTHNVTIASGVGGATPINVTACSGTTTQATSSTGGGGSHTHTISLQLAYIDVILASKN